MPKAAWGWVSCQNLVSIADVADSKRHQRLDKILIIFTRTIQEISKVVCRKTISEMRAFTTSLCCMKRKHYSKRMLRKQDCVKFCGHIAWQSFFENNFADFFDVVKKIKILSSRWWRFQLHLLILGVRAHSQNFVFVLGMRILINVCMCVMCYRDTHHTRVRSICKRNSCLEDNHDNVESYLINETHEWKYFKDMITYKLSLWF